MMTQETSADLSLKSALREARIDEMTRHDAILATREAEFARLALLADYLRPVFADIPAHIDLFDVGLVAGDRPRFFVDMVAFVEMDEGKHIYCFYQDTRAGRMLLGRAAKREEAAKLVLDYVARRLVAREQLLAMPTAPATAPVLQNAPPQPYVRKQAMAQLKVKRSFKDLFTSKSATLAAKPAAGQSVTPTVIPEPALPLKEQLKGTIRAEAGIVQLPAPPTPSPIAIKFQKLQQELTVNAPTLSTILYVISGLVLAGSAYVLLARLLDMALQQ